MKTMILVLVAVIFLLSFDAVAKSNIDWEVVSCGSTDGSSTSYQLMGSVGQTAVGPGNSETYEVNQGYWQDLGWPYLWCCGDADSNGLVNISDAVYLIAYIFGGGLAPDPLECGDVDCNELVNISDVVYLIAYIFGGGPEPCASCR